MGLKCSLHCKHLIDAQADKVRRYLKDFLKPKYSKLFAFEFRKSLAPSPEHDGWRVYGACTHAHSMALSPLLQTLCKNFKGKD